MLIAGLEDSQIHVGGMKSLRDDSIQKVWVDHRPESEDASVGVRRSPTWHLPKVEVAIWKRSKRS